MEKQKLLFHQSRLASRGVYEMVLQFISAAKGAQSDMVMNTLELGISILRGGNVDIQMVTENFPFISVFLRFTAHFNIYL
jgi:ryanodine receptor 2